MGRLQTHLWFAGILLVLYEEASVVSLAFFTSKVFNAVSRNPSRIVKASRVLNFLENELRSG